MLLPLSPDTVRNFLPQGAQLVIANNHFTLPSIVSHFYHVNMAPIRFVLELLSIIGLWSFEVATREFQSFNAERLM